MFGTLLKAQETSPTLVLAHASIGDEGVLEIAHFLAASRCLVHLDLTANGISSTGALHLAKALKQNRTLESLVLNHNKIGDGGDAGLVALCRALHGNETLRHLDLRHNGLSGALNAVCLGEMLQNNTHLTHLELSWNALDPAGGQVLLDHVSQNTSLFDCQLTGCKVADETLLGIAQLLHRNRRAKGAEMQAGPYRCTLDRNPGRSTLSQILDQTGLHLPQDGHHHITASSLKNKVVAKQRTEELISMLIDWRDTHREHGLGADTSHVQELIDCLEGKQREVENQRDEAEKVRERTALLIQGSHDREMRYRGDIATAQDKLRGYALEHEELKAILNRQGEELSLWRETLDQVTRDLEQTKRSTEAEEGRLKNDLAIVEAERRELDEHMKHLKERSQQRERENAQLRAKVEQVREGVVTLHRNAPLVEALKSGCR